MLEVVPCSLSKIQLLVYRSQMFPILSRIKEELIT